MLKNAIAYILRKRNRTIIVFIILTVVLSCLYSCLNITKSTNNLEKNLYKISNTSLSIIKNNGDTFETNRFKELDNIKEIKEIITTYDGLARTTNITQKWISKAGLSKLRVYFSGDDLWEWTKVKDGYDPEYGENSNNTFPFSRLLTFGVDVTF